MGAGSSEPVPFGVNLADFPSRMMSDAKWAFLTLPVVAAFIGVSGLFVSGGDGRAAQTPRMSLDMVIDGNAYVEGKNAMAVGSIENCIATGAPGDNAEHNHQVHLIIQDVQDLVGWQARLNYDGARMRPATANVTPFTDGSRGQNISFVNLPIDPASGVHRDVVSSSQIPPPAEGAQTAAIGAAYVGAQTAQVSPDTPPKTPPDDTSYSAPSGGILASLNVVVSAGQAGQASLSIDVDDGIPNAPGSGVSVFTGQGTQPVYLEEGALGDGFHAEGVACVVPATQAPPPTGAPGSSPGGTSVPGDGASPGTSPGATSPGETAPADGATPDGQTSGTEDGDNDDADDDNGDGTPWWVYALIAAVPLAAAAGFAAWRFRRFRSRLPWFRG